MYYQFIREQNRRFVQELSPRYGLVKNTAWKMIFAQVINQQRFQTRNTRLVLEWVEGLLSL